MPAAQAAATSSGPETSVIGAAMAGRRKRSRHWVGSTGTHLLDGSSYEDGASELKSKSASQEAGVSTCGPSSWYTGTSFQNVASRLTFPAASNWCQVCPRVDSVL